jgi:hypothetical protein
MPNVCCCCMIVYTPTMQQQQQQQHHKQQQSYASSGLGDSMLVHANDDSVTGDSRMGDTATNDSLHDSMNDSLNGSANSSVNASIDTSSDDGCDDDADLDDLNGELLVQGVCVCTNMALYCTSLLCSFDDSACT